MTLADPAIAAIAVGSVADVRAAAQAAAHVPIYSRAENNLLYRATPGRRVWPPSF